jgi:protein TonB
VTDFRLQRNEIQAPLAAPTYLTHVTAPSFRRGRFFTIAVALHVIAIVAFLVVLHLKYPVPPPYQPTLSLVVTNDPYTGSGPEVIVPVQTPPSHSAPEVLARAVPAPHRKAAPPAAEAADRSPDIAHTAKLAFLPLPAPAAPPAPKAAPSPRPAPAAQVQHLGDNQPQGSGLVMDTQVIPAVPDANVNQPPQYPRDALIHGEQGRVLLSIHVLPDGRPSFINIATGSGYAILDQAAEAAVMQWRFQPAVRGGKPVPSVLPFWISFELN